MTRLWPFSLIPLMLLLLGSNAPTDPPTDAKGTRALKREFRAVWVATFHNIDWPKSKGMNTAAQKREFLALLKRQKANGMNAVVVQVRPSGDALYPSRLAPWSEYLTGIQGKPPSYDPLAFMIEAAHEENMEFHAWFNPFRAISHVSFSSVAPYNIAKKRPDWTFKYGQRIYLNPGKPQVRKYLTNVIAEVVNKYDIDGIHFDDYFYPYPKDGEVLDDSKTFLQYREAGQDVHAWRRSNIDAFISSVSDTIRKNKPHVKFGISPVGVWRNARQDARGPRVRSTFSSYDVLHADVRKWLEKGWIDYVAPQLYFNMNHPTADYSVLVPWWARNSFGKHVYIGQAMFKVKDPQSASWRDPFELPRQLKFNLRYPQVKGSIFYSASSFNGNPHSVESVLRRDRYKYPALVPSMSWKDSIPPLAPQSLKGKNFDDGTIGLTWDAPEPAEDGQQAHYYVIYRFGKEEAIDMEAPAYILGITRKTHFIDANPRPETDYTYVVTAVDRLHNESKSVAAAFLSSHTKPPVTAPIERTRTVDSDVGSFKKTVPYYKQ
ncbi:MAG: family 10 glycosylhydrolase [Bacteroidota bacterium]